MPPAPNLSELIQVVRTDAASEDALELLAQASRTVAELEEVGDALLGHFVDQCRRSGRSWSEISRVLGVTKQAAHKRFSVAAPPFDRFTPRARFVLESAPARARDVGAREVGTEHLLLALFEPAESIAAQVLREAGLAPQDCERHVPPAGRRAGTPVPEVIPYGPGALDAIRAAVEEALRMGHNYIGTEHILLAILRDPDDPAAATVAASGVDPAGLRGMVVAKLVSLGIPGAAGAAGPTG